MKTLNNCHALQGVELRKLEHISELQPFYSYKLQPTASAVRFRFHNYENRLNGFQIYESFLAKTECAKKAITR
jgi:hypothetical protein